MSAKIIPIKRPAQEVHIVDHVPNTVDETQRDFRKVFSSLTSIELALTKLYGEPVTMRQDADGWWLVYVDGQVVGIVQRLEVQGMDDLSL